MVASKKRASKKTKTSAKKKTPERTTAATAKHKIEFALDPERVAAIQRCLEKGTLRVTVDRAALLRGRVKDPWLYD
jgi:anti-sigma28 factor (negative regulator of flagellin synthesis)